MNPLQPSCVVAMPGARPQPSFGTRPSACRVLWYDPVSAVARQPLDVFRGAFHVAVIRDPSHLLRSCREGSWNAVVVCADILDEFALGLVLQVRRGDDFVGIVVLTGVFDETFVSRALSSGADDFASLDETSDLARRLLLASRRRLLPTTQCPRLAIGNGVSLDLMEQTVCTPRGRVQLAANGFRILACLARAAHEIVTPEQLCDFTGIQRAPGHANLQTEIWRLRRTLDWLAPMVENVRGKGYRMRPDLVVHRPIPQSINPARSRSHPRFRSSPM